MATNQDKIPSWVDPNYSYDPSNPRKPNMKELVEILAGESLDELYKKPYEEWSKVTNQASNLLSGTIGANEDTRDWQAITSSATDPNTGDIDADKLVDEIRKATAASYSGNSPATRNTQKENYGNVDVNEAGVTKYVGANGQEMYGIVAADGLLLRGGFRELDQAMGQAKDFGLDKFIGQSNYKAPVTRDEPEARTPTPPSSGTPGGEGSKSPDLGTPDPIPSTVNDALTIQTQAPTYAGGLTSTGAVERPDLGTVSSPLQTAELSAVPESITVRPQYTGTTMRNLTSPSQAQGQLGVQNVVYKNNLGQTLTVTEINGQPTTYVPPGYVRQAPVTEQQDQNATPGVGAAKGGDIQDTNLDAMYRMATKFLGYNGPKTREALSAFKNSSPAIAAKLKSYGNAMVKAAAKGGMMTKGFADGGSVPRQTTIEGQPHHLAYINPKEAAMLKLAGGSGQPGPGGIPAFATEEDATATLDTTGVGTFGETGTLTQSQLEEMQRSAIKQTMQPRQATIAQITPQAADFIAPTAGQTVPQAPFAEAAKVGTVEQAMLPTAMPAAQVTPATAAEAVQQMTQATQAAQGAVSTQAQVQAAQQAQTSVTGLEAAQGTAIMMDNPVQREIQAGELISGAADAEKAAAFNEQIQAAQATPSKQATVAGQLETLMQQFEGGNTPAWAAGSMRAATATLAARGLGASSLAGQAVIQAAMEAALPIAQLDAQTQASFEAQNLSNRQQRAMLAAQQRAQFIGMEFDQAFQARVQNASRIADIADQNFTAEQQIALENSRAANTVNLQNLNNRQAKVMAEAAALSQLDTQNLNNRQQAAVQNAQNFMQMDLTNLSNEQQTNMFNAQQNIQALFTDQAAENAAQQFNAASENQTNQFFSSLSNQTAQFNAAQRNAMDQFNVNSVNALREFNSEIQQQRDLFNAQNGLIIAQANAQWRQQIATANTAAQNESNMQFAMTMNDITASNMDRIWQRDRDLLSFAFQIGNNNADRATTILAQKMAADAEMAAADAEKSGSFLSSVGSVIARSFFGE